jgi:hypothetical protein
MADNSEIEKIQRSITEGEPYFFPAESPPDSGRFIQPEVFAKPGEVLDWFNGFTLDQGFRDLIQSLENNSNLKLKITSFSRFPSNLLQLSFNAESITSNQGFLVAAEIEVIDLQFGSLVDVQNIGLSLSYEPGTINKS